MLSIRLILLARCVAVLKNVDPGYELHLPSGGGGGEWERTCVLLSPVQNAIDTSLISFIKPISRHSECFLFNSTGYTIKICHLHNGY